MSYGDQMETVTVSPKYQVVIPKSVRDAVRIAPGEKVVMFEQDGVIHLVRLEKIRQLRGRYPKVSVEGSRDERDRF